MHPSSTHFTILINFYNSPNIEQTVLSAVRQNHPSFSVLVIDDASTDTKCSDTAKRICERNADRARYRRHECRQYATGSRYQGIQSISDDSVIVFLDGDDWLMDRQVLEKLDSIYREKNPLLTLGSFECSESKKINGWCPPIPKQVLASGSIRSTISDERGTHYPPPHLRTCPAWFAKKVRQEDLLDSRGKFFEVSGDIALFYPLIEMACERTILVEEPLCVYNETNPLGDYLTRPQDQIATDVYLKSKPSFQKFDPF